MKRLLVVPVALVAALAGAAIRTVQDQCGPFTDVSPLFCPYVLEAYYTGITAGTSPTTFSPDMPITRGQAAVFTTKALNQALARGSRRASLGQWWTTKGASSLASTGIGEGPGLPQSDGADIWVPDSGVTGFLRRVRASDGRVLESWTGVNSAYAALVAMGRVFVSGYRILGRLYMADPSQPAGDVSIVASNLGGDPGQLAFDGSQIWSANATGSVSIVTPSSTLPWAVTTVSTGFVAPAGILFDGQSIWVTDLGLGSLLRLDAGGAILQTVPIGNKPAFPGFDGVNLWVPDIEAATVTVVQASTGKIVRVLTGNGLASPFSVAFDGRRMLVAGNGLSLWNAADLTPLGSIDVTTKAQGQIVGVCSDGTDFWVSVLASMELLRF